MGKPYSDELDAFATTFRWSRLQDVDRLRHFLNRWSGDHAVVVGSGGSFSSAVVVALFRELAHHSPTTPCTPLEFESILDRLSPRALLLSAEGKNRDVLAAARAAQAADLASGALTLTSSNPLVELARSSNALRAFPFQMDWIKDGYLATNSLLATVFLLYRAFFGDHDFDNEIGPLFEQERLVARRQFFAALPHSSMAATRGVLVLHSADAKAFAIDLESKLAEAAMASVQIVDLRQFAHGRHLQLALREPTPFVLLVASAAEMPLATATAELLPDERRWIIELPGMRAQDIAVAGLLDAMFLTETFARGARHDPGQPEVPEFGRNIHGLDPAKFRRAEAAPSTRLELGTDRKAGAAGAMGLPRRAHVRKAASDYAERLTSAHIHAVVCDFDGTLCRAENRFDRMDAAHVEQLSSLLRQGLKFAIATGRGGSLHESLRCSFEADLYPLITVGYYSGSLIATLDQSFRQPPPNPAFEELWQFINGSAFGPLAKPFDELARGGQFSVRLRSSHECARLRDAVRTWLDLTGRRDWRAFSSGHSVDVLDASTSKGLVVQRIAENLAIDPLTEVLRVGDCGHECGNDFELLGQGLGLSCDSVSSDLGTCWNFSAAGTNQAEAAMAYLRSLLPADDAFRISPAIFSSL